MRQNNQSWQLRCAVWLFWIVNWQIWACGILWQTICSFNSQWLENHEVSSFI